MGNVDGKIEPDDECDDAGDREINTTESSKSIGQNWKKSTEKLASILKLTNFISPERRYTIGVVSSLKINAASKVETVSVGQPNSPEVKNDGVITDDAMRHVESAMTIAESVRESDNERSCSLTDCIRAMTPCCQKKELRVLSDFEAKLDPDCPKRIMRCLDVIGEYFRVTINRDHEPDVLKTFDVKSSILQVIRFCNQAIQLLHRIHEDCGDSLKDLSYYFEENLSPDQMQLIRGRSSVGSYMWLIVLAMQSIRLGPDQDKDFAEIRRILEDIVGESFVIWRGIRHIVDAFLEVRNKTEELLAEFLEIYNPEINFKFYLSQKDKLKLQDNTKTTPEQKISCAARRKDLEEHRKDRRKSIELHNLVGGNEHPDYEGLDATIQLPLPPDVYIARTRIDIPDQWMAFQKLRSRDRMIDLTQLVRRVMSMHEDVLENLRNMDRCLHLLYLDDQNPTEMSYIQVITHMRKHLKKVRQYSDQLDDNDLRILLEMSNLLSDEMHLTEFLVMTLRSTIHESRHVIHVAYEYARVFNRSLLMYEEIAPPNELTFCEKIGWKRAKEDLECRKIPLRNAIALFNASPYVKILLAFPVCFDRRYQLMLKPLGADIKGVPAVGGIFKQIHTTHKVVSHVQSASADHLTPKKVVLPRPSPLPPPPVARRK